ncbi:MAG: SurA N-terminal domain-containing protein [Bacteroidales bacterium]|nr:SurA N-terminal domain-containing protein [Bacteroidales bacterium]
MAVLEKIRVKFGLAISIIIALALLSFIIDPNTVSNAWQSLSSKNDVGVINGKGISYFDFLEDIERYKVINEIVTGSSVQNEQQQKQMQDAAWQELVDRYMFVKNAKAAGLNVSDEELLALTTGENASPVVTQNPAFCDEQGNFSPDAVVEFVKNIPSDASGRMRIYWNFLQKSIYNQQFYAKYGSIFNYSATLNSLEKARIVAQNNTTADFDYVTVYYPFQKDTSIVVSKSEIKAWYKDHTKDFERKAERDVEYVVFEVVPSADDIAAAADKMNEAYADLGKTDNIKTFMLKNSDRQYKDYWYKAGELESVNHEIEAFVAKNKSGVSPIITEDNTFYAARIMATAQKSDSVYVKHIMLRSADADHLADSLLNVLAKNRKQSFSALAAQFSDDKSSADGGELGNIGWLTQTRMIPGFEGTIDAVVGKPYKLKSQYGTHIVLVSKKTKPVLKKQVAILEKTAVAGKETFNKFYSQANSFATLAAHSVEGYKKAVDSLGVYSHRLSVNEGTASYGSIDQAKEVTRWIFGAKKGKASDIITVNNSYFFVVAVNEVRNEGVAPLKEVSAGIEQTLYGKKLAQVKTAEVAEKIKGLETIEAVAEAFGLPVQSETGYTFPSLPGRSNEPALAGAALLAPEGQVFGPVAGRIASYVVKVNKREVGEFFSEDDAKSQANQLSGYKAQMIVPVMEEACGVKDNRARFF